MVYVLIEFENEKVVLQLCEKLRYFIVKGKFWLPLKHQKILNKILENKIFFDIEKIKIVSNIRVFTWDWWALNIFSLFSKS